jgi:hypothetical protein
MSTDVCSPQEAEKSLAVMRRQQSCGDSIPIAANEHSRRSGLVSRFSCFRAETKGNSYHVDAFPPKSHMPARWMQLSATL